MNNYKTSQTDRFQEVQEWNRTSEDLKRKDQMIAKLRYQNWCLRGKLELERLNYDYLLDFLHLLSMNTGKRTRQMIKCFIQHNHSRHSRDYFNYRDRKKYLDYDVTYEDDDLIELSWKEDNYE